MHLRHRAHRGPYTSAATLHHRRRHRAAGPGRYAGRGNAWPFRSAHSSTPPRSARPGNPSQDIQIQTNQSGPPDRRGGREVHGFPALHQRAAHWIDALCAQSTGRNDATGTDGHEYESRPTIPSICTASLFSRRPTSRRAVAVVHLALPGVQGHHRYTARYHLQIQGSTR